MGRPADARRAWALKVLGCPNGLPTAKEELQKLKQRTKAFYKQRLKDGHKQEAKRVSEAFELLRNDLEGASGRLQAQRSEPIRPKDSTKVSRASSGLICGTCGQTCDWGNIVTEVRDGAFLCPSCRIRHMDPFHPLLDAQRGLIKLIMVQPPLIPGEAQHNAKFKVNMDLSNLRQWRKAGQQLSIRMCSLETCDLVHCWPTRLTCKANGRVLFQVDEPKPGHKRRDVPRNISADLKQGMNEIEVELHDVRDVKRFAWALVRSSPQLPRQLCTRVECVAEDQCVHKITNILWDSKLASTGDQVECDSYDRCSLACPITLMRMETPSRGYKCKHLQCFDLVAYLVSNQRMEAFNRRWSCPVCTLQIKPPQDLFIDTYQLKILSEAEANVEEVAFESSGAWRSITWGTAEADSDEEALAAEAEAAVVARKHKSKPCEEDVEAAEAGEDVVIMPTGITNLEASPSPLASPALSEPDTDSDAKQAESMHHDAKGDEAVGACVREPAAESELGVVGEPNGGAVTVATTSKAQDEERPSSERKRRRIIEKAEAHAAAAKVTIRSNGPLVMDGEISGQAGVKSISRILLVNTTGTTSAFKIKTTQPKDMHVSPVSGVVDAGSEASICIELLQSRKSDGKLVVLVSESKNQQSMSREQWAAVARESVKELRVHVAATAEALSGDCEVPRESPDPDGGGAESAPDDLQSDGNGLYRPSPESPGTAGQANALPEGEESGVLLKPTEKALEQDRDASRTMTQSQRQADVVAISQSPGQSMAFVPSVLQASLQQAEGLSMDSAAVAAAPHLPAANEPAELSPTEAISESQLAASEPQRVRRRKRRRATPSAALSQAMPPEAHEGSDVLVINIELDGRQLGCDVNEETLEVKRITKGSLIAEYNQSNPSRAVRPGDRFLKMNGALVHTLDELVELMQAHRIMRAELKRAKGAPLISPSCNEISQADPAAAAQAQAQRPQKALRQDKPHQETVPSGSDSDSGSVHSVEFLSASQAPRVETAEDVLCDPDDCDEASDQEIAHWLQLLAC